MPNLRLNVSKAAEFAELVSVHSGVKVSAVFARLACNGKDPIEPMTLAYGFCDNGVLVGCLTATYMMISPNADAPDGSVVMISGLHVLPEYRGRGVARAMISSVESDAREFFLAGYVFVESVQDAFWESLGYKAEVDETIMLKSLRE